jgi:hypothetical protein
MSTLNVSSKTIRSCSLDSFFLYLFNFSKIGIRDSLSGSVEGKKENQNVDLLSIASMEGTLCSILSHLSIRTYTYYLYSGCLGLLDMS